MGTLAGCLKQLGIDTARAKYVTTAADAYKREGFDAQTAHERVVRDLIKETRRQQRSVIDQIWKQVTEVDRGKIFPESVAQPVAKPAAVPPMETKEQETPAAAILPPPLPTKGLKKTPEAARAALHEQVDRMLAAIRKANGDESIQLAAPVSEHEQDAQDFLRDRGRLGLFFKSDKGIVPTTGANFEGNRKIVFLQSGREENALWQTVGHELAHSTGFDKGSQADESLISEYAQLRMEKATERERARMQADPEHARREGIAEMVGDFMSKPDFRTKVLETNPSLFGRLRDAILKVVGKFNPRTAAAREALDMLRSTELPKKGFKKVQPAVAEPAAEPSRILPPEAAASLEGADQPAEVLGFGSSPARRTPSPPAPVDPEQPAALPSKLELALFGDRGFVARDVIPKAGGIVSGLREAGDQVLAAVAPHLRGKMAKKTSQDLREYGATLQRFYDQTEAAYRDAHQYFAGQSDAKNVALIQKAQTGELKPDGTPATDMQIQFDKDFERDRSDLEQVKPGVTDGFKEWYFPQEWKNPEKAQGFFAEWMRKRPLEGSKGFLKRRKYPTIADGIAAGLEPATTNLADLALNKRVQIRKYVEAQRMVNDKIVPDGRAQYFSVNKRKSVPDGWVKLEDPMFTKYGPPTVALKEYVDEVVYDKLSAVADRLGVKHTRIENAGRGRLGFSEQGANRVTTQAATGLSVLAHEIGHQLDYKYGLREMFGLDGRRQGGELANELRAVADLRFDGKSPEEVPDHARRYSRKSVEKIAQVVEAFVHAPDRLKEVAPNVYDKFKSFVENHDELSELANIKPSLALKELEYEKAHGGMLIMGYVYAPEEVATVVNNYMSKSLESQSKLFAGLQGASRLQTMFNLGLSAFHGTMTARQAVSTELSLSLKAMRAGDVVAAMKHLASSPAAPILYGWQGRKLQQAWVDPKTATPEYQIIADAIQRGGGRPLPDKRNAQHFSRAVAEEIKNGNWTGAGLRLPGAAIEQASRPILEQMVPKLKSGAAFRMMQFELEHNPDMSPDEIRNKATDIWNSVDNRMGQVVHDNTMTKGIVRSIQNFMFRAFQYQAGTFREFGGAAVDTAKQTAGLAKGEAPQLTHKMAYAIADATFGALAGGLTMYLLTGKKPQTTKDLFFPQDGGEDKDGNPTRLRIPGYINDLVSVWHSPVTAFEHKMNPLISEISQLIHNRDYFGEQIYGPEGQGLANYAVKQGMPFSVQNLMKMREQGEPASSQVVSSLGIGPAPGYLVKSKAQNTADAIRHEDSGGRSLSHAQAERFKARRQLTELVRTDGADAAAPAIKKAIDAGTISENDISDIVKRSPVSSLEATVKGFTPAQGMRVYADATDDEKKRLYPILWGKIERAENLSDDERQKMRDELGPALDGIQLPDVKERGDFVGRLIYQATEPPPRRKLGEKTADYQRRVSEHKAITERASQTLAAAGATDHGELRKALVKEQRRRGLPASTIDKSGNQSAFGKKLQRVKSRITPPVKAP
jgi:hypothetical protein